MIMTYRVVALYQFVPLPECCALLPRLRQLCADLALKGTILLAPEGINGTVAGLPAAVEAFVDALRQGALFGGKLDDLTLRISTASAMPFRRLKLRVKREIVTFDAGATDPRQAVGTYVDPAAWNALLQAPDVVPIDMRNAFEVALGSFAGAIDPGLGRFSEFKPFVRRALDPARPARIALFCTGGIRCEKASSYLVARGFDDVYHLKGGILNYLDCVPEAESRWTGTCFVFDERVSLSHGLTEIGAGRDE